MCGAPCTPSALVTPTTCVRFIKSRDMAWYILALGLAALRFLRLILHVSPRPKFVQVASALTKRFVSVASALQILGTLQVFNLRTALFTLMFGCGFLFPLIPSFHRPCAPWRPRWSLSHYFGCDPSHSMHLANEFGLTARASVSSSRPPKLGICCCRCFV